MFPKPVVRALAAAVLIAAAAAPLHAATRLTYGMSGRTVPVYWASDAFPIPYEIDRRLTQEIPNGAAVVDRAFNAWAAISEANVAFRAAGIVDGAKAGWDKRNTVSLTDGLMRDYGFLALTTNWYDSDGKLSEADIQVDSSIARGDYNPQLTIEHEIGHLLGLDHSAVISAVMYPYVGRGSAPVTLTSDDRLIMQSLYPKDPASLGATLQGKVYGDGGGVFAAQVVAVSEAGEPVATALTDSGGEFRISGVPAGTYRLYAEPLDGPVDTRNLAGVWREAKATSFPTEFFDGPPLQVESGKVYGNLQVNVAGAVRLNPKWIGANEDGSANFSLTTTPIIVQPNRRVTVAVAGDGFTSGMTTFEVMNPGFARVSGFTYAANFVYATFSIAPDAPGGSAVILVRSGNETATLTGALTVLAAPKRRSVRH